MPEITEDEKRAARDLARIARINEVSAMARTSWITLLAYLAFVMVTLLGVEDADFFVPSRQTQLPLVNVSIPTASFFWFAPALGAALYVYLQLILLKLWDAIADVEAAHLDDHRVGDLLNPWLANDWALILRGGAFAPDRPLRTLGFLATIGLVWLAGPIVLGFAWWRSMPAHDEWMTLWLGGWFALALLAGIESCRNAWERLRPDVERKTEQSLWDRPQALIGISLTLIAIGAVGWDRTESGAALSLAPADLADVEMVVRPDGWRDFEVARRAYRETWCKREGLEMAVCGQQATSDSPTPVHLTKAREEWCEMSVGTSKNCADRFAAFDRFFDEEWHVERQAAIGDLPTLDLSEKDFRLASASGAMLEGADLRRARLERADLRRARLAGANFSWAQLEKANLSRARLEGANLSQAQLKGVNLSWARLAGANLMEVKLEGADLSAARLEKANLNSARLKGANLNAARLEGARLINALLEGANLFGARLEEANLWQARLERADLRGASLEEATLTEVWLVGADLSTARLERADLSRARLEGANLSQANFRDATWAGALSWASPAQFADLRTNQDLMQSQLEQVIGNGETLLPDRLENGEAYYVWSCWEVLPEGFDAIIATAAGPFADDADRANLRQDFLCGRNPRRKTGTPLALDAPYPSGHPLANRSR